MKINSINIELFQNISQFNFDNEFYDFHNDFECINVKLNKNDLILLFKNSLSDFMVSIHFQGTTFNSLEFEFVEEFKSLTLDNLYRGKFETDGKLIEFENNKGYFYLDFYEGITIEFWCESILVKKE
jgi:hypothetical protein